MKVLNRLVLLMVLVLGQFTNTLAQRITESLDNWTLGYRRPSIERGRRGDGSLGDYFHVPKGTDGFCLLDE